MQIGLLSGHSLSSVQATHFPSKQAGVAVMPAQSILTLHCAHEPSGRHAGVVEATIAHCGFVMQAPQVLVVALQIGLVPEH